MQQNFYTERLMKQTKASFHLKITSLFIISLSTLNSAKTEFSLGLENIPDEFIEKIKHARIGLITNQTGKDQSGNRNIDILRAKHLNLTAILVPEHGLDGTIPAGQEVLNTVDKKTGIPIVSLYKEETRGKDITKDILKDLDVLIFDIQDSGTRHYTYVSTMFDTLKAAGKFGISYIILDRPNPLGHLMEGPLVDATLHSFVSIAPIPLRHAMTIGELGWFFNKHLIEKQAKLHVIKMNGYNRTYGLKDTPFTMLSPNIASLKSCHGYSFLGLLSAMNPVDVGLTTDQAFQIILLPERISLSKAQWKELRRILKKYDIQSAPYKRYHSKNKETYTGLKLKISNINNVHSFMLSLDIMDFFKKAQLQCSFAPIFDKLTGTKAVRLYLQGTMNRKILTHKINTNLKAFLTKVKPLLMYDPIPQPVFMS